MGIEEYRARLNQYGLPEFIMRHLQAIAIDYQNGIFSGVDGVIGQATGRAGCCYTGARVSALSFI